MTDNSDLAAAALKPNNIGRCGCAGRTKDLKARLNCPKCKGSGKVHACENCHGSGWDKDRQSACARCAGNGYLAP